MGRVQCPQTLATTTIENVSSCTLPFAHRRWRFKDSETLENFTELFLSFHVSLLFTKLDFSTSPTAELFGAWAKECWSYVQLKARDCFRHNRVFRLRLPTA